MKCNSIVKIKIIYRRQYTDMIEEICVVREKLRLGLPQNVREFPFGAMKQQTEEYETCKRYLAYLEQSFCKMDKLHKHKEERSAKKEVGHQSV
jgi:hypothetical protein